MDRAIFDLSASVLATSLYILVSACSIPGKPATLSLVRPRWNGNEDALRQALEELLHLRVLAMEEPIADDRPIIINPKEAWLWPRERTAD